MNVLHIRFLPVCGGHDFLSHKAHPFVFLHIQTHTLIANRTFASPHVQRTFLIPHLQTYTHCTMYSLCTLVMNTLTRLLRHYRFSWKWPLPFVEIVGCRRGYVGLVGMFFPAGYVFVHASHRRFSIHSVGWQRICNSNRENIHAHSTAESHHGSRCQRQTQHTHTHTSTFIRNEPSARPFREPPSIANRASVHERRI